MPRRKRSADALVKAQKKPRLICSAHPPGSAPPKDYRPTYPVYIPCTLYEWPVAWPKAPKPYVEAKAEPQLNKETLELAIEYHHSYPGERNHPWINIFTCCVRQWLKYGICPQTCAIPAYHRTLVYRMGVQHLATYWKNELGLGGKLPEPCHEICTKAVFKAEYTPEDAKQPPATDVAHLNALRTAVMDWPLFYWLPYERSNEPEYLKGYEYLALAFKLNGVSVLEVGDKLAKHFLGRVQGVPRSGQPIATIYTVDPVGLTYGHSGRSLHDILAIACWQAQLFGLNPALSVKRTFEHPWSGCLEAPDCCGESD